MYIVEIMKWITMDIHIQFALSIQTCHCMLISHCVIDSETIQYDMFLMLKPAGLRFKKRLFKDYHVWS